MYQQALLTVQMLLLSNSSLFTSASAFFFKSTLLPTDAEPSGGRTAMSSLDGITPLQAGASEMIILHLRTVALPQCCISVSDLMLLIKKENRIKAATPARQWETRSVDLHVSHLVLGWRHQL